MYRKIMIKDSWARNMFSRSNMDYCLDDVTSEVVYDYASKFNVQGLFV